MSLAKTGSSAVEPASSITNRSRVMTPSSRGRVQTYSNPASTDAKVGGSRLAGGPLICTKLISVIDVTKNTRQVMLTSTGLIV